MLFDLSRLWRDQYLAVANGVKATRESWTRYAKRTAQYQSSGVAACAMQIINLTGLAVELSNNNRVSKI